jgi:uncharacterized protein YcbK (DUF882 family)
MSGPSPHLSWDELACKDLARTPYPEEWRTEPSRLPRLAAAFEALRARVGQPLTVLSAYRTPAHNRAIHGAINSQHKEGRALDLRPPAGWSVERLAQEARQIPDIRGIGVYPTFLHIDVRPQERMARWLGARPAADVVTGGE